jgi:hypothetical protein
MEFYVFLNRVIDTFSMYAIIFSGLKRRAAASIAQPLATPLFFRLWIRVRFTPPAVS